MYGIVASSTGFLFWEKIYQRLDAVGGITVDTVIMDFLQQGRVM
jgi:hypothetical protein